MCERPFSIFNPNACAMAECIYTYCEERSEGERASPTTCIIVVVFGKLHAEEE